MVLHSPGATKISIHFPILGVILSAIIGYTAGPQEAFFSTQLSFLKRLPNRARL